APVDRYAIVRKERLVMVGRVPRRLPSGRPESVGVEVAHIKEEAVGVAGAVARPAGERVFSAHRIAASRRREARSIGSVREHLVVRSRLAGRAGGALYDKVVG